MRLNSFSVSVVTWILSLIWTLLLTFTIFSWNINTSQGHILRPSQRVIVDIESSQNTIVSSLNSQHEPEIAQIKFITGLRHKRDLSQRDFHIIQVYRPSTNSTTIIHLHKKNSLVSHDFKVVIKNGDDDEPEILSGEEVKSDCLYHGSIPSDPGGKAALSACGGHFGFSGLVMSRDEHWMIEPHPVQVKSFHETLEIPHIIHFPEPQTAAQQCNSDELRVPLEDLKRAAEAQRSSNETEDEETNETFPDNAPSLLHGTLIQGGSSEEEIFDETSGNIVSLRLKSKTGSRSKGKSKKRQTGTTDKKTVEIAVFADADFYSKMKIRYPKETANKVKNYVLTVMNSMDLLYEQPSLGTPLEFRLVHLEIQQKWPTKLSNKHKGKAKQYLTAFCDYAGDLNTRNELWDHALMLTGMDLVEDGSSATAGLAWAGTMCYRYYSCSISEATQFGVVYVITHEIGHSMGMEHDGSGVSAKCDKNKYLMSPTTGPGKVAWSNCSSQNLKDFIEYGTSEKKDRLEAVLPECLTESSRETKVIDYTSPSLPGQKYDADKQCALAMGKRFTSVVRKSAPFNNICSMLYCGNTTHSISTHPALEGTTCETGKHCRAGECVVKK